jgi:hypothetical protein
MKSELAHESLRNRAETLKIADLDLLFSGLKPERVNSNDVISVTQGIHSDGSIRLSRYSSPPFRGITINDKDKEHLPNAYHAEVVIRRPDLSGYRVFLSVWSLKVDFKLSAEERKELPGEVELIGGFRYFNDLDVERLSGPEAFFKLHDDTKHLKEEGRGWQTISFDETSAIQIYSREGMMELLGIRE